MTEPVHRFRMAVARHLGSVITPEVAAAIEAEAFHEPDRSIDPERFEPRSCGTVVFQLERLGGIVDEIDALTALYWRETEPQEADALDVDYDALLASERRGTLLQFTARRDGQLVGHFRAYLQRSMHTKRPYAREDMLYLLPQARHGCVTRQFLLYARACMRSLGYRTFRITVKHTSPAAARLLRWYGFDAVATEYVLKEPDHEPAA